MTRDRDLAGRRALITGAGQGIGRATAEAFIAAGADVLATDIEPQTLATLSGCRRLRLDATDPAAFDGLVDEGESFDILFNCAGVVHSGTILDCREEDWSFAFELNVTAMYRAIRALLPGMMARGGGSIINMSSVAGSVLGVPNRFAYGASKAAVIGLIAPTLAALVGLPLTAGEVDGRCLDLDAGSPTTCPGD